MQTPHVLARIIDMTSTIFITVGVPRAWKADDTVAVASCRILASPAVGNEPEGRRVSLEIPLLETGRHEIVRLTLQNSIPLGRRSLVFVQLGRALNPPMLPVLVNISRVSTTPRRK